MTRTFQQLGTVIGGTVEEKNRAYGSSFATAGDALRLLYPNGIPSHQLNDALLLARIWDKMMRIATDRDALGENPYSDIAGYGILGVHMHQQTKGHPGPCASASAPDAASSSAATPNGSAAQPASAPTTPRASDAIAATSPQPSSAPSTSTSASTAAPAATATANASSRVAALAKAHDRNSAGHCAECDALRIDMFFDIPSLPLLFCTQRCRSQWLEKFNA